MHTGWLRHIVRVAAALALPCASMAAVASPAATAAPTVGATAPSAAQTLQPLQARGAVNLRSLAAAAAPAGASGGPEIPNQPQEIQRQAPPNPDVTAPQPTPRPLTTTNPGLSGISGLDHLDQRTANNGNQFSLEPPDQGVCVGNGFTLETVNNAISVWTEAGHEVVVPTVAANPFFGLAANITRSTDPVSFGPFAGDLRCYYEPQIKRFVVSAFAFDTNPLSGVDTGISYTMLAVSASSDPTQGWGLFAIDNTDNGLNGTAKHAHCPCLGDQPDIGSNATGFYVSTNEYSFFPFGKYYNGAQIYAFSKSMLARAATAAVAGGVNQPLPTVVHLEAGDVAGRIAASVQPTLLAPGSKTPDFRAYFLSSFDNNNDRSDQRVTVWALSGTGSLTSPAPKLVLTNTVLATEPYVSLSGVKQKPGAAPLAASLSAPLNRLQADDDRMQEVAYNGHDLWGAVETGLGSQGSSHVGVAWFRIAPGSPTGPLDAHLVAQGYLGIAGDSLIYPSLAVSTSGNGLIALDIAGPSLYPSVGYVPITANEVSAGPVHVAANGTGPEDGFTCYAAFGPAAAGCRWGDYSAAAIDEAGNTVFAGEWIPATPRTSLANWGTWVGTLQAPPATP